MSYGNFILRAAVLAFAAAPLALAPQTGAVAMPDMKEISCLARDTLTDYLDRAYGEGRIAQAELDNGNQVELFLSRRGSWTLVELIPDGQSCVHAYGQRMKVNGGLPVKHNPS